MKAVASHGRTAANARIDSSTKLDANQKQTGKDFSDLISEIATDIAGMDTFNGCLRTWSGNEGKLTTVGAARVSNSDKFRERLQKFKQKDRVEKPIAGVELHHLTAAHWKENAPELFDAEGSVYVGTSDKAIWFALGPEARERIEQAIQAAAGKSDKGGAKGESQKALDLHAELQPLARVWDAIGSRQPRHSGKEESAARGKSKPESQPKANSSTKSAANGSTKSSAKSETTAGADGKPKPGSKMTAGETKTKIADLQLHKVAGETFKDGNGRIDVSLTHEGDKVKLLIDCDEGVLRFAGKILSVFTKQNLAD
jgi:hypothetical protein